MILAERAARLEAEAVAARAQAVNAGTEALITHYRLEIEKLRRQLYGTRSEKKARLLEQMELQLEELEGAATEDELAAEQAAARTQTVQSFQRKRPSRKPFPDHLPRERVIIPGPTACACCGGARLSRLGEDITETLEVIPKSWKVIQHVREKFTCRDCEKISQAPAPFHVIARGWAGRHPQAHLADYTGIFQADAYDGYRKLYEPARAPGQILEAACWVHARRPFFVMADLAENARRKAQGKKPAVISPLALEAVRRIDELFEIERAINGQTPERRRAVRQELSAPLVANLEAWMREQRAKLSRGNDVAKAMDYMLKRWAAFTRFLGDGRICLSNNAAERGVRGIALGRKSWLFCGSDRGGERAAVMYSLIVTAKMNDIDPQAWLADVLARIAEHPVQKLDKLLPWNWRQLNVRDPQAA